MIFYVFFLVYLSLGICLSALLFWWAASNGQFSGQARAAYLPLAEAPLDDPGPEAGKWSFSVHAAVSIVAMAAALFAAALAIICTGG